MLDLVIIGGSAAGCSAAIYAVRRKLNFRFISLDIGGEVALSGETNNWPGIQSIQGYELAQKFAEHVRSYGVTIEEGWTVTNITPNGKTHFVTATKADGQEIRLETKAVIIATGIHPRKLGVPGEEKLDRKGVTYCTVCDGPLYRNKDTVTIGAGNSALESALMMGGLSKNVYVLTKYPNTPESQGGFPKGDKILVDKLKELPNVKILYEAETLAIEGETKVEGLKYKDKNGEQTLAVQGAMIHIGMTPNSWFAKAVEQNKQGEIMVDKKCHTNVPGIFAAGDVTDVAYKQIGIAVGQGITASLAAIEYINLWKE